MSQAESNDDNPNATSETSSSAAPDAALNAGNPGDRVLALEQELAKAKDQALRALAEAENTRKRSIRDREDASKYAIANFARDMLDFADNFHRALTAIPAEMRSGDSLIGNVITGIEAMEKEIARTFEKHGITKLEPLGSAFDANFHEVIFEAPGTGKAPGIIIQVIEPGYLLKDRLLRPARVGVAKNEGGPERKVDTTA